MAAELEPQVQAPAPAAPSVTHAPTPGKQTLGADAAEGSRYSGASVFDAAGDAGGGDGGDGGGDGAMGDSIESSAGGLASGGEGGEAPTDVAEQGFAGPRGPLPFQAQLERSFGVPLGGVQAYTDDKAQDASARLGANAYASGNRVAFGTANPDMKLVAHEVTHVLQHTGEGPAKKSDNGGSGGIETSGEAEAEGVESAVAAGKPARSALQGDRGQVSEGKGPGPALKAGQKPALSSRFGTGMTFSPNGLEQSGSYSLWKAPQFRVPIAAVPGLSFLVAPGVSVGVGGGVDWKKKAVTARLTVDGGVMIGLAYGVPAVAEVYGGMEANASGGFTYERTGGEESKNSCPRDSWSLHGGITLSANLAVGVKLGGGILDKKFQFGTCEIGKVTGLAWKDGVFQRNAIGWTWGSKPQALFREIKKAIDKAKMIMNLPKEAAARAWKGMKDAGGWAAGKAYGAATAVLGGIKDGAGAVVGAGGKAVDAIGGLFGR